MLIKKVKLNLIEKEFRAVNYLKLKDINIYLYDGSHHYEDHFDSIKFALPALSKKFIFIVDDWNWIQVRQGTLDSIENENLKIIYKLDVRTTRDNSSALLTEQFSDWHQGFCNNGDRESYLFLKYQKPLMKVTLNLFCSHI